MSVGPRGWPTSFPADAEVPSLAAAADARRFLPALARGLGIPIERGTLIRVRYRRGSRCVLHWRVQSAGTERLVTAAVYAKAGRAERTWRKLPRDEAWVTARAIAGVDPAAYVPEVDALVQVYPYDRRLPGLALALGERQAELVQYRPGLGAVLRGRDDTGAVYVKLYRADEQPPPQLPATSPHFDVVERVGFLERYNAVVLRAARGAPLIDLLGRADAAAAAASALTAFHDTPLPLRRVAADDRVAELARSAALIGSVDCEAGADAHRLVEQLGSLLDDDEVATTHRDLKPDHVLLDGDRVTFLDLDSAAAADPVADVGLLLARISSAPRLRGADARAAAATGAVFSRTYFARSPRRRKVRLEPHLAAALLETAASTFRRQHPGWRDHLPALVAEGSAVLAAAGGKRPVATKPWPKPAIYKSGRDGYP